jgi:hypothetical protein
VHQAQEAIETFSTAVQTEEAVETPAEIGRRLADEVLRPSYRLQARRFEKTVRRLLGRRVTLPRARGLMRVKLKLDARCSCG